MEAAAAQCAAIEAAAARQRAAVEAAAMEAAPVKAAAVQTALTCVPRPLVFKDFDLFVILEVEPLGPMVMREQGPEECGCLTGDQIGVLALTES
jgi:hypothetical protein